MDRALDGERPAGLAEHLATCEDGCAEEWAQLVALERRLRDVGLVAPPPTFHAATMARLAAGEPVWVAHPAARAGLSFATVLVGLLLTAVGLATVGQALRQPGEASAWLATLAGVADVLTRMAVTTLAPFGRGVLAWPLYLASALALALLWYAALVLPRRMAHERREH
jgi:hypothetical protein